MDFPGGFFGHEQTMYHRFPLVSKRSSRHGWHYSQDIVNLGRVTQDITSPVLSEFTDPFWGPVTHWQSILQSFLPGICPRPPRGCQRKLVRNGCATCDIYQQIGGFGPCWSPYEPLILNLQWQEWRTDGSNHRAGLSSAADPLTAQAETLDLSGTWGNCQTPDPDLITHPAHFLCAMAH